MYGCSMSKGMSSYARTKSPAKYCNGSDGETDYYTDFNQCMASLQASDDGCTIVWLGDYTSGNQIQTTTTGIDLTIDGSGYTWTDTAPTSGFTFVGNNTGRIWIKNLNMVGATVVCEGAGTELIIDHCDIEGTCYQRGSGSTTDTLMVIHDCRVEGVTGGSSIGRPLIIASVNPKTVVSKSYLKGYTGYGAVNFSLVDNDKLQIEHSTLMHGDLSTNNPFENPPASGSVDYAAHHTTFNAEPAISSPTKFSNVIDSGQRHNTIDPDGDYAAMNEAW
jgi:hypothetical protein